MCDLELNSRLNEADRNGIWLLAALRYLILLFESRSRCVQFCAALQHSRHAKLIVRSQRANLAGLAFQSTRRGLNDKRQTRNEKRI